MFDLIEESSFINEGEEIEDYSLESITEMIDDPTGDWDHDSVRAT